MIEVAFNLDKYTLECAYVSAHSLLAHTKESVRILFLLESQAEELPKRWLRRLADLSTKARVEFIRVDNSAFRHCKSLFGSHATYLRIYAPQFSETERMIYSDTDVVFTDDIKKLHDTPLHGATIGLPGGEKISCRSEKERRALTAFNRSPQDLYYGSGLAIIDVGKYMAAGKISLCEAIAKDWAACLTLHEQTVWNCAFTSAEMMGLDNRWCQSPPLKKGEPCDPFVPGIVHFAGSPKPWDLFGEFYHHSYGVWAAAQRAAGRHSQVLTKYFNAWALKRAYRIRKQYAVWFGPLAHKL